MEYDDNEDYIKYEDAYKKYLEGLYEVIIPVIGTVQHALSEKYNINDGENKSYKGLCNEAVSLFKICINEVKDIFPESFDIVPLHGEQKHHPRIKSSLWSIQHTWCLMHFNETGINIYIDCTCKQFEEYYKDIPEYYISDKPPKWFYWDGDNLSWSMIGFKKILNKLNEITKKSNKEGIIKEGIIEFFQYNVWGRLSDIIHKIFYNKKGNTNGK